MWNVSSAVEYEEPRTNNASEGSNNGLARHFSTKHPDIWKFIDGLRLFHSEQEMKFNQLSEGIIPNEPQRKNRRELEAKLKEKVDNYDPSRKLEFIQSIGNKFA